MCLLACFATLSLSGFTLYVSSLSLSLSICLLFPIITLSATSKTMPVRSSTVYSLLCRLWGVSIWCGVIHLVGE